MNSKSLKIDNNSPFCSFVLPFLLKKLGHLSYRKKSSFSSMIIVKIILFIFKIFLVLCVNMGFPGGSGGKESTSNAGDLDSIAGLGRSLEKGTATHSSILFLCMC